MLSSSSSITSASKEIMNTCSMRCRLIESAGRQQASGCHDISGGAVHRVAALSLGSQAKHCNQLDCSVGVTATRPPMFNSGRRQLDRLLTFSMGVMADSAGDVQLRKKMKTLS